VGYELRKGRIEDAKSRCLEILRLTQDPHLRDVALTDLGVANLRLGDFPQAKLYFDDALQVQPRSSGGMLGLGLIAEHNGDFTSAIDYFSRAVSIEHTDLGYLLLAVANEQDGHIEQARIAYAEAQRLSPEIRDTLQMADELLPHHSLSESAYTGATPGFVAGR
jgi:Flp pilus assembly protein TadD